MSTGIANLDKLIGGGLREGSVTLVIGPPGSGKTILGHQFCFHNARDGAPAVYVTQLAETHGRMREYLQGLSFFDPTAIGTRLTYISGFQALQEEGLERLQRMIRSMIVERRARVLVLDELVTAEAAARSPLEFKQFIHAVQAYAGLARCTVVLLSTTYGAWESSGAMPVVDGLIQITAQRATMRTLREIEVVKMRGTRTVGGRHLYELADDGWHVHPRVEATLGLAEPTNVPVERVTMGMPELDRMLRGGMFRGDSMVLLGGAGAGKTLYGLHFIAEGARLEDTGLVFGFYEGAAALLEGADHVGLDLRTHVEAGRVDITWLGRREHSVDAIGHAIVGAVRARNARRVFIDGFGAIRAASVHPDRLTDVVTAIANELRTLGATTMWTDEAHEPQGPYINLSVDAVSAIAESIVMLRCIEQPEGIHRSITIRKARGSDFATEWREFWIRATGIEIATTSAGVADWFRGVVLGSEAPVSHVDDAKGRGR